jgi:hypothetical protein
VPPVLDSLDNYKMLSKRMNVLTIYLHRRNWSSVLTSAQPESAVCIPSIILIKWDMYMTYGLEGTRYLPRYIPRGKSCSYIVPSLVRANINNPKLYLV